MNRSHTRNGSTPWQKLRGPLPVATALLLAVMVVARLALVEPTSAGTFGTSAPTITSVDGHDRAGTTTHRPITMSVGMTYYNITTGRLEVANGASLNNVTDVPDATTTGGTGLPNGMVAGTGGTGVTTTAGGAGGSLTLSSGSGGAKTGTGAAAGGAAGSLALTAGNGGATASSGSNAGGAGGALTLTSGNGGAASAGTGNGGAAGSINLVLGTGGTSAGGTPGANGQLQVNGAAGLCPVTFVYSAPDDQVYFVAARPFRVVSIIVRPLVVGSDGGSVTATMKKAASGTAIASGTALHSGSADLKGTVNTNQSLTLSTTSSDLDIATGTAIGIDVTGTTTAARGVVTVLLNPQ